jgi:hypothetical protein
VADTRPIVSGPGDKLRQLEAVATHPDTTALDSQVSIVVSSRIDKYTGDAVVGQSWIAKAISCGERSVRGSAARMQRLRLWQITQGGGRGLANKWKPLASKPGNQPPGFEEKPGNNVPGIGSETRQIATLNPANRDTKPGTQLPPLPNKNLNSSYPHPDAVGDDNPIAAKWQSVRKWLVKHPSVGEDAWVFDKLTVKSITDTEVVMVAPSTFVRHEIEKDVLHQRLTSAWRAQLPTITRVRLVDPPVARATG